MNFNAEHIDALIAAFLEGRAAPEEIRELEVWRANSEENERYFQDLEFVFHATASIRQEREVDIDAAWNKVRTISERRPKRGFLKGINLRIAAVFIGLALISTVAYFVLRQESKPLYAFSNGAVVQEVYLPDSTLVRLQPYASIQAVSHKNARRFSLDGEAYFEIKAGPGQFELELIDLLIRDIGTAFDVSSKPDTARVRVVEGIVEMQSQSGEKLELSAGESAYYFHANQGLQKIETKKGLRKGSFRFEEVPLAEVCRELEDHYQVHLDLDNPALETCTISVRFEEEALNTVLDIIALTLELEWTQDGDTYRFKGSACQ